MTTVTVDAVVTALVQARLAHSPLQVEDWRAAIPDAAAAYEIQDRVAATMDWFGASTPRYWKSGGGSRDKTLTHAPLPPPGVRASPADFSGEAFLAPRIEVEIALRLGCEVDADRASGLGHDDADALIDAMCVSIEIVDSRWDESVEPTAPMKLADLQSHGALVLGTWVPYARRDWAAQPMSVRIGRAPLLERTGTHPLGSPLWVLPAWLRHATRGGQRLSAGSVVTTGSWVGMLPVARGDEVSASFAGVGSAELRI
jgi:2-keto-4-pentenoate hydratase